MGIGGNKELINNVGLNLTNILGSLDLYFWNYFSNAYLISTKDLTCPIGVFILNFIH